jgi:hypothetical protein
MDVSTVRLMVKNKKPPGSYLKALLPYKNLMRK